MWIWAIVVSCMIPAFSFSNQVNLYLPTIHDHDREMTKNKPLQFEKVECRIGKNDLFITLGSPRRAPSLTLQIRHFDLLARQVCDTGSLRVVIDRQTAGQLHFTDEHGYDWVIRGDLNAGEPEALQSRCVVSLDMSDANAHHAAIAFRCRLHQTEKTHPTFRLIQVLRTNPVFCAVK